MSKKDFFIVVIRVTVVYLLLNYLFSGFISMLFVQEITVSWVLAGISYIFLLFGIILSAPRIVSILKLEDSIDAEQISLKNINAKKLLQLGFIFIGIYFIANNIYYVISDAAEFLYDKTQNSFLNGEPSYNSSSNYFIQSVVSCLIGLLMTTKSEWLSNLLHKDTP